MGWTTVRAKHSNVKPYAWWARDRNIYYAKADDAIELELVESLEVIKDFIERFKGHLVVSDVVINFAVKKTGSPKLLIHWKTTQN